MLCHESQGEESVKERFNLDESKVVPFLEQEYSLEQVTQGGGGGGGGLGGGGRGPARRGVCVKGRQGVLTAELWVDRDREGYAHTAFGPFMNMCSICSMHL